MAPPLLQALGSGLEMSLQLNDKEQEDLRFTSRHFSSRGHHLHWQELTTTAK